MPADLFVVRQMVERAREMALKHEYSETTLLKLMDAAIAEFEKGGNPLPGERQPTPGMNTFVRTRVEDAWDRVAGILRCKDGGHSMTVDDLYTDLAHVKRDLDAIIEVFDKAGVPTLPPVQDITEPGSPLDTDPWYKEGDIIKLGGKHYKVGSVEPAPEPLSLGTMIADAFVYGALSDPKVIGKVLRVAGNELEMLRARVKQLEEFAGTLQQMHEGLREAHNDRLKALEERVALHAEVIERLARKGGCWR